ncbi:melanopsin-like [Oculina patagonica]
MKNVTTEAPSTAQATKISDQEPRLSYDDPVFIAYIVIMTIILVVGFVGNVLTIVVLRCKEHRNKNITPLMINLAIADIIIIVFGYPVVVAANVSSSGLDIRKSQAQCVWSGFINGSVGIASIANLTMMSVIMFTSFKRLGHTTRIPRNKMAAIITFTWLYGVMAMFPPLVGWNEFVPGAAAISCCPNWVAKSKAGMAYNALLVFIGFILPLGVIIFCYYRIYRFIHTQQPASENASIKASRRKSQIRIVRTIAMAIAAFVLSWSPYCLVSIIATIRGTNTLTRGEAEVPELLAKASVIYNPIVYTVMNDRFRATLLHIVPCGRYISRDINPAASSMSSRSSRKANVNSDTERKTKQSEV